MNRQRKLRIFFFSDWRVQSLELVEELIKAAGAVDVIVYGGDDVARFAMPSVFVGERRLRLLELCFQSQHQGERISPRAKDRFIGRYWRCPESAPWRGDPKVLLDWMAAVVGVAPNDLKINREASCIQDLLQLFSPFTTTNWFSHLSSYARAGVIGVIGNDCLPEERDILESPGVTNIHRRPIAIDGWGFAGIEGNIVSRQGRRRVNDMGCIGLPDEQVPRHLRKAIEAIGVAAQRLIIVSHTPPAGALDLALRFGVENLGSPALRRWAVRHKTPLILCGHVHNQGGKVCKLSGTVVVNAASDDRKQKIARAAVIDISSVGDAHVTWLDPTPMSAAYFPGISSVHVPRLSALGVVSFEDARAASQELLVQAGFTDVAASRVRAYQRALTNNEIVCYGEPALLPAPLIFYDVETGLGIDTSPEPWLIGAMVEGQADVMQWSQPSPHRASRRRMLERFISFLESHPAATLCYWAGGGFDVQAVANGIQRHAPNLSKKWSGFKHLNMLSFLRRIIALPILGWNLDVVADAVGVTGPKLRGEIGGFESGLAYELYRRRMAPLPQAAIERRNSIEVRRLAGIVRWYRAVQLDLVKKDSW